MVVDAGEGLLQRGVVAAGAASVRTSGRMEGGGDLGGAVAQAAQRLGRPGRRGLASRARRPAARPRGRRGRVRSEGVAAGGRRARRQRAWPSRGRTSPGRGRAGDRLGPRRRPLLAGKGGPASRGARYVSEGGEGKGETEKKRIGGTCAGESAGKKTAVGMLGKRRDRLSGFFLLLLEPLQAPFLRPVAGGGQQRTPRTQRLSPLVDKLPPHAPPPNRPTEPP